MTPPRARWQPGRWLPRLCLLLALGAAGWAVERAVAGWQAAAANRLIADGATAAGAPPSVLLAHAAALERAGRFDEALSAYAEAEALGSPDIRHAVHVNVANLYLRRGIEAARGEGHAQRAMVLLQLAKAGYRSALREQPGDWNARYNYELALRVLPDFEVRHWRRSGNEVEVEDALKKDKSAWTEMVGTPRGMH
ncbi:hypothetical protein V4F39_05905 [Aquincola sp. MAHUQ-54]|uniref:MxaK protein n=1 Tax=Aquincola agrisoli TaxID=3119538 RepID=A0AAW9Q896_9BURK